MVAQFGKWRSPFSPVVLARAAARFRITCPDVAGACLSGLSAGADEFQHHAALSIALGCAGNGDAVEALAYQRGFALGALGCFTTKEGSPPCRVLPHKFRAGRAGFRCVAVCHTELRMPVRLKR